MWPQRLGQRWSSRITTHADQLTHQPLHVERAAVAGVPVHDQAHIHGGADAARGVHHLCGGEQAEVGLAEARRGQPVARQHHGGEAGAGGDARREGVVHARHHHHAPGFDQGRGRLRFAQGRTA
jgi:hypothetical protein